MVGKYGADSVRSYILFMGPAESDAEWNDQGIEGVYRFLGRVWRQVTDAIDEGLLRRGGARRRRRAPRFDEADADAGGAGPAGQDQPGGRRRPPSTSGERFHFNTALAAIMELNNDIAPARAAGLAAAASGKAGAGPRPGDDGAPAGAVRPAHGRRAVGDDGPRGHLGRALAGGRPALPHRRHGRAGRAGQRQGARPGGGGQGRRRTPTCWRPPRRCRVWPSTWKARRWSKRWSFPAGWSTWW